MTKVRRATKSEANSIAVYQVLMADESEGMDLDMKMVKKGVAAVFDDPQKGFYLAGEVDGYMVACMLVTHEWSDWRAKTIYWIQSLYVEPVFRKKGVFRSMYEFLKDEIAAKDDVAGVRLYVDIKNANAIEVYKSLGMNGEHYKLFEDID